VAHDPRVTNRILPSLIELEEDIILSQGMISVPTEVWVLFVAYIFLMNTEMSK
jgi:hypothetical protein